jgi:peptidoglycan/xylan/chitin deacetylase (PgdA/CDA1 family)
MAPTDKNRYNLPVLLYHRIVSPKSTIGRHKIYVYEKDLIRQMEFLKVNGYQTITFHDLQKDPTMDLYKKVILTFDDGYEDNYTLLFPILKKYGFRAVIYLVTQARSNFWGMREGEPPLPMMTPLQVKEMSDYGMEMGGHTQTHVDLLKVSAATGGKEISGSKQDVEWLTHLPAVSFAYPFGALNPEIKKAVRDAGFLYAVATNTGPKKFGHDNFQIRRIEITPKTTLMSFKRKVSGRYFEPSVLRSLFTKKKP